VILGFLRVTKRNNAGLSVFGPFFRLLNRLKLIIFTIHKDIILFKMKVATRLLTLLAFVGLAVFYASCDKEPKDNRTAEEKQLDKLKTTWKIVSANDGTDRTADFPGLVLTLSGSFAQGGTYNYSFTGTRPSPSPWPANGTWKFGTDPLTQIIRDPGTAIEIDGAYEVSDTDLQIAFLIPDNWTGGRTQSVSGTWTFQFVKQ
jgi:hypothetical protein